MSTSTIASKNEIQFLASHRPVLEDGTYTITAQQDLAGDKVLQSKPFQTTLEFAVAGPRFALAASDILEVFPPKGSTGDYSTVLPHVILNRGTLPWERTADPSAPSKPPWLVLLVFRDGEGLSLSNTTVGRLKAAPAAGVRTPVYGDKPGNPPPDTPVSIIQVPSVLLSKILPSTSDLGFVAHARRADDGIAHAVVIANRLPEEGAHMLVHLVSIEGLYGVNGFSLDGKMVDSDKVQLVSLFNWDFFCLKEQFGQFQDIMKAVAPGPFRLGSDPIPNSVAKPFLEAGFAPLAYHLRQGDSTVSWYHGPLIPLTAGGVSAYNSLSVQPALSLPARSADELLLYHLDYGIFDVSYAAAWELGRLPILQNSRISAALFQWKREYALETAARAAQTAHLAKVTPPAATPTDAREQERQRAWLEICDWFQKQLALLEGVPFNYIAPDEQYLPNESVRFFAVDPLWIRCLWDGAFSLGRAGSGDLARDAGVLNGTDLRFKLPDLTPAAGLLLRSSAVTGFSSLLIDAYFQPPTSESGPYNVSEGKYPKLRQEQLSPNVSFALFDITGHPNMAAFDFYLPPEAIHFGIVKDNFSPPFRYFPDPKVIDLTKLAQNLGAATTPAVFAKDMISGVPVVRFSFPQGAVV